MKQRHRIYTEVSQESHEAGERIKDKTGISPYTALQILYGAWLAFNGETVNDSQHALSADLTHLVESSISSMSEIWRTQVQSRAIPVLPLNMAISVYRQHDRRDRQRVYLQKFSDNSSSIVCNAAEALDALLKTVLPSNEYGRLKKLQRMNGDKYVTDSLRGLVNSIDYDSIHDEIQEEFDTFADAEPTPTNTLRSHTHGRTRRMSDEMREKL